MAGCRNTLLVSLATRDNNDFSDAGQEHSGESVSSRDVSRDELQDLAFPSAPLGEVCFVLSLSLFYAQEQLSSFFRASENEGSNYSETWESPVQTPRQKLVFLSVSESQREGLPGATTSTHP